jgi:hypothetical protein
VHGLKANCVHIRQLGLRAQTPNFEPASAQSPLEAAILMTLSPAPDAVNRNDAKSEVFGGNAELPTACPR